MIIHGYFLSKNYGKSSKVVHDGWDWYSMTLDRCLEAQKKRKDNDTYLRPCSAIDKQKCQSATHSKAVTPVSLLQMTPTNPFENPSSWLAILSHLLWRQARLHRPRSLLLRWGVVVQWFIIIIEIILHHQINILMYMLAIKISSDTVWYTYTMIIEDIRRLSISIVVITRLSWILKGA